jgi:hypothetical protein
MELNGLQFPGTASAMAMKRASSALPGYAAATIPPAAGSCLQHVSKQMVVAIPPAAVVERDQEQVSPVQRLQHGLAATLPGDGIAQRTAQKLEPVGLEYMIVAVTCAFP